MKINLLTLLLSSTLLITPPLLSMEDTNSSIQSESIKRLEAFGNQPLAPEICDAIIDALFPMYLSVPHSSPTDHKRIDFVLIENNAHSIKKNLADQTIYNAETMERTRKPVTLIYLWEELIAKPLIKDHKYANAALNIALKKWVAGYYNEHVIVPSFSRKLQGQGVPSSEADAIALWLLNYQIDKTFSFN